ncbi:MAG: carbohydrate kinase [Candidatus Thiodiazotropha sp.]
MTNNKLIIFGEVLYDCFPDGSQVLGGAPFNVSWHLQAFGQAPYFISRVGQDEEGRQIGQAMHDWGMDTGGLQRDPEHVTGKVVIRLQDGEPSYDILSGVAYDFIDQQDLNPPQGAMLYHGSLALRQPVSRQALSTLRQMGAERVFLDVNLRPPWFRKEEVLEWASQADWVKLNQDELVELQDVAGELEAAAEAFRKKYRLEGLILTRGAQGAMVFTDHQPPLSVVPQAVTNPVDTVGAGDAFTSVLLMGLYQNWPLSQSLERAQTFASAIVGQRGATVRDPGFYRPFLQSWGMLQ